MATPLSSMALVSFGAFIGSFGAAFLKAGATRLQFTVASLARNWRLALGVFFFCFSSIFFVLGLKEGELSVLYPMVSLGYVWTLLWSRIFFGERLTMTKLAGLALILIGVLMVGLGTERDPAVRGALNPSGQVR
ncbi:MAG: EamA family transporter [Acidobacteria bacterium]|nr:EamA family transporter [Acidobacteriota bacterium]